MEVHKNTDSKYRTETYHYRNAVNYEKKHNTKSLVILLLNITDLICTWVFVVKNPEYFSEVNPLASRLIINFPITIFTKLSVLILVLLYLKTRSNHVHSKGLRRINWTLNIIIYFYLFINIIHMVNFLFLFLYF